MSTESRVLHPAFRQKIMSAEQAAAHIMPGDNVGMSGFTGSGHPKVVPVELAKRIEATHARGEAFRISVWTGASTAPELDGALAKVNGIEMRLPYQSDPVCRQKINEGTMQYADIHLSHVAQHVWFGFYGKLNVAIIEVTAILEDGSLVPSTAIGNNKTWLDQADKVILEVNSHQSMHLHGMHDVYYGTQVPPHRLPIPMTHSDNRIGVPYLQVDPAKVVAVVETNSSDRNTDFTAPDAESEQIAAHLVEFFQHEVKLGRLPRSLLPLQSGVGNIANAVLAGLNKSSFENMTAYTEVLQDGMLDMIASGKLRHASATAVSLSKKGLKYFEDNIEQLRSKILLRPQEISNHPELIRRLGTLSMNGMIEADIYGNVNSTHIMGTRIMNGIGGSGDFARNAYISVFMTPSIAKGGNISCIVPMVSHVDHTEHDVQVLVTEQGLADLRGLAPKARAKLVIEKCAHPSFKDQLTDYYERSLRESPGKHTPHILTEALSWHQRFEETGSMKRG
ncbi:acetyl-CoA hydrolase/transferase family protein [Brachymonas denitrificans]|uniref:Succinyl-CoA:acetate CoA-transferase n=1 Tax=Brachymonas denitrificans DSM 15123 TaxID=1121117 RepID=A0A1H8CW63_9BURK|nr:acetyl-CoA hydrolase/transferase family protein [Brachymonas denitrificans]SEM98578.1 succinyl-CoA:acetate CoA-transferase [Brachymonas denitrificans DSM 15123]